jgi:SAM-dependent methyltransferase
MKCQVCEFETLTPVLDMGMLPLVNDLPESAKYEVDRCHELSIIQCGNCSLVQLSTFPAMSDIFPEDYPYLSGLTPPLLENFSRQAEEVSKFFKGRKLKVLDIGSNDGSLLSYYKHLGNQVLGIEPTSAADVANSTGILTIKNYFNSQTSNDVIQILGKADVVTATNVFAHIPEPVKVVENISQIMSEEGIFVSENHYFLDLVESLQIDTIYHEHLRYYTLHSVSHLLQNSGFEVFRVDRINSHGGSIRVWSGRKGVHPVQNSVSELMKLEKDSGFIDGTYIKGLQQAVMTWRLEIRSQIASILKDGGRIVGVGAPSRAVTLVTYLGLNRDDLHCIVEKSGSKKIGKRIPSTKIPIVDESTLAQIDPTHLLILSWHIKDSLIPIFKGKGYRGLFLTPLPNPIVSK